MNDTIAAIATAAQAAPRGVIRVTGPATIACVRPWFTTNADWTVSTHARVFDGDFRIDSKRAVPVRLYLWPTARSYTRQPTAEIHTIGALPLLSMMLNRICESGARLAEPGEFTLRAFLSGRLDLTQAEAVLGVIDADNKAQLRLALGQLAGGLSRPLTSLRDELLDLLADLEAGLDFVEEDIAFISYEQILQRLAAAHQTVGRILSQMTTRSTAAIPPTVVLVGAPNVGKSSLFNALADAPVAIVSRQAGTTRDYVSHPLTIGGQLCELLDTAGQSEIAGDNPASRAQAVTHQSSAAATVRLLCFDASRSLRDGERLRLAEMRADCDIIVLTKSDLPRRLMLQGPYVLTSTETGKGLAELRTAIGQLIARDPNCRTETLASTSARCRDSLGRCVDHLQTAALLAREARGDELTASEIRLALEELGQVAGAVYSDDILDRIFSRFCIGK